MDVKLFGEESIFIKSKKESWWINPGKDLVENKDFKESRLLVFLSFEKNFLGLERGERVLIYGPGEYEVGGVEIVGFRYNESGLCYVFFSEGVKIVWLSELPIDLGEKKKERVSGAELLIIGGGGESKEIWEKTKTFGANFLLVLNQNEEERKKLLDLADSEDKKPTEKLEIDKESLPEVMEVVVLAKN